MLVALPPCRRKDGNATFKGDLEIWSVTHTLQTFLLENSFLSKARNPALLTIVMDIFLHVIVLDNKCLMRQQHV